VKPRDLIRHTPTAVDQALSSASNFLLAVLVAQTVTAAGFGRFAVATSAYWIVLGALRALISEPLLILLARQRGPRAVMSSALGLAVTVALAGSLAGAALLPVDGARPVAAVLISLPVLIWQDTVRYCAFSLERPVEALISDAIWLGSLLAAGAWVLFSSVDLTVTEWLFLWAGCAIVPAVAASIRLSVWPALRGQQGWWSRSRRQGMPMLGDFAVLSLSDYVGVFLLPLVASFALLGQWKAAQTVSGPLSILMTAGSLAALPALARRWEQHRVVPLRAGLMIGAGLATVAFGYGLVLLVVPDSWGELLFGDAWVGVGVLPALIAFQFAVIGINQGALFTLRAIGGVRPVVVARLVLLPVGIAVPLGAASFESPGVLGAALIALTVVYGVVWWTIALRAARRGVGGRPAVPREPVSA
jgi:O-antigen/teichoic acid export membrane protein